MSGGDCAFDEWAQFFSLQRLQLGKLEAYILVLLSLYSPGEELLFLVETLYPLKILDFACKVLVHYILSFLDAYIAHWFGACLCAHEWEAVAAAATACPPRNQRWRELLGRWSQAHHQHRFHLQRLQPLRRQPTHLDRNIRSRLHWTQSFRPHLCLQGSHLRWALQNSWSLKRYHQEGLQVSFR